MTESARFAAHPSPDELADLREGLLPDDAVAEVEEHVAGCPECSAEVAALDEVAALLADEGGIHQPLPADVADRLDEAIARVSAERAAGVPSLEFRRQSLATRSFKWLGAAAAIVVIGAGGISVLSQGQQGSDDAASGGGGGDVMDDQPEAAVEGDNGSTGGQNLAPGEDTKAPLKPQRVSPKTIKQFAVALDGAVETMPLPVSSSRYYAYDKSRCDIPMSTARRAAAPVRWTSGLAFLVVKPEVREATVYTCETPPERLYSTPY